MKFHTSYGDAFKDTISSQTFAIAHLHCIHMPMNIDTSGCYKLFYFLTGEKKFHIGDKVYGIKPKELYLVNQRDWHYFSNVSNEENHERYVVFIYPDYLRLLSTEQTDLCACFSYNAAQVNHNVPLSPVGRNKLICLLKSFLIHDGYGCDIIRRSIFEEFIVFINNTCLQNTSQTDPAVNMYVSTQLNNIVRFIKEHITEDLSLEILSSHFYISSSYLCRQFKQQTGTTIHKYITAERITLAKDLLSQGYSVTDACMKSGFKDYNGFLKSFVDTVGIPPKKYAQFSAH